MSDKPTEKKDTRDTSLMDALFEYERKGGKILFWVCPKGCDGYVTWVKTDAGHIATCETCKQSSQPMQPR